MSQKTLDLPRVHRTSTIIPEARRVNSAGLIGVFGKAEEETIRYVRESPRPMRYPPMQIGKLDDSTICRNARDRARSLEVELTQTRS